MSVDALRWAFHLPLHGAAKSVLLALADHADQDHSCWPSVARIALFAGVSDRGVLRAVKELQDRGVLAITRARGRRNRYVLAVGDDALPADAATNAEGLGVLRMMPAAARINPGTAGRNPRQGVTSDKVSPVTRRHPTHDKVSPLPLTRCHGTHDKVSPEPLLTTIPTTTEPALARDGGGGGEHIDFETFEREYPRSQNRAVVAAAWATAIAEAAPAAILAGLRRFKFPAEAAFAPMPATWLRDQRWRGLTPAAAAPAAPFDRSPKPMPRWLWDRSGEQAALSALGYYPDDTASHGNN